MQSRARWTPRYDYFNGVSGKRIEDAIAYCKEAHKEDEAARRYLEEQYNANGVLLFKGVTCFAYPSQCRRSDMRLVGTKIDGQVVDATGHMENVESYIFMPKVGSAAWCDITHTLAPALFFSESNYLCVRFADKGMDTYVLSPDNKTAKRSTAQIANMLVGMTVDPHSGRPIDFQSQTVIQFRVPRPASMEWCSVYNSACESDDEDCVIRRA